MSNNVRRINQRTPSDAGGGVFQTIDADGVHTDVVNLKFGKSIADSVNPLPVMVSSRVLENILEELKRHRVLLSMLVGEDPTEDLEDN